jgi:hypothetical protein
MNFYAFRRFSPVVQLLWVIRHGAYLAQRWDDACSVNLYYCEDDGRGFFMEVGIDDGRGQAVVLRSFVSSEPLEVQLPSIRACAGERRSAFLILETFPGYRGWKGAFRSAPSA